MVKSMNKMKKTKIKLSSITVFCECVQNGNKKHKSIVWLFTFIFSFKTIDGNLNKKKHFTREYIRFVATIEVLHAPADASVVHWFSSCRSLEWLGSWLCPYNEFACISNTSNGYCCRFADFCSTDSRRRSRILSFHSFHSWQTEWTLEKNYTNISH